MSRFCYSSVIDAPLEKVWQFHERPDVLQLLTPPWQPVEILSREGGLGVGAKTEFRLWLGFIPIDWLAYHTACEPYQYFTDQQIKGPMHHWHHRHEFQRQGEKTLLSDCIDYTLIPNSPLEPLLEIWVNSRLEDMFHYRHQVTQRECSRK